MAVELTFCPHHAQGPQVQLRFTSDLVDHLANLPKNLSHNCYNRDWLQTLIELEILFLKIVDEDYNFALPASR